MVWREPRDNALNLGSRGSDKNDEATKTTKRRNDETTKTTKTNALPKGSSLPRLLVCSSVCLFVRLSVCPFVRLSACLLVCLSYLFRFSSRICVICSLKPPSFAKFSLTRSKYLCISINPCFISTIAILAIVSSFRLSASDVK